MRRAVLTWACVCAALLLASLYVSNLADTHKAVWLGVGMFSVTAWLLYRICKN
jgi:hypothetical protein